VPSYRRRLDSSTVGVIGCRHNLEGAGKGKLVIKLAASVSPMPIPVYVAAEPSEFTASFEDVLSNVMSLNVKRPTPSSEGRHGVYRNHKAGGIRLGAPEYGSLGRSPAAHVALDRTSGVWPWPSLSTARNVAPPEKSTIPAIRTTSISIVDAPLVVGGLDESSVFGGRVSKRVMRRCDA
jgi:hypothetical protein